MNLQVHDEFEQRKHLLGHFCTGENGLEEVWEMEKWGLLGRYQDKQFEMDSIVKYFWKIKTNKIK